MKKDIKCRVDFECLDPECKTPISFNLMDAAKDDFQPLCPSCRCPYEFEKSLKIKLHKLLNLILAIREAENILGDCNVSVNVPGASVKIPYTLLLTRLNTLVSLEIQGKKVDFHLRIEPSSPETFK
jgi:hypothetical protein